MPAYSGFVLWIACLAALGAGFVLSVLLYIPALIVAGLNHIAGNSRLTQGTSWHRHH